MKRAALALCAVGTLCAAQSWSTHVHADCAPPTGYTAVRSGHTVTVCPINSQARSCPDAAGMLRQNVETGEAVRLPDLCVKGEAGQADCYADECVPKGVYRYGFAQPYACCQSCCGTSLFESITVDSDVPPSCQRSDGNSGPTGYGGTLPWEDDPILCDGPVADAGSGDSEADGQVASTDADTIRVPTGADPPVQYDSGCSVRKPSHARDMALSIHAAVLLLAWALLVRRRGPAPRRHRRAGAPARRT